MLIRRLLHGWYWILMAFLLLLSFLVSNLALFSLTLSPAIPQALQTTWQEIQPFLPNFEPVIAQAMGNEPSSTPTPSPIFISLEQAEFFATTTASATPYQPVPPTATHTLTPTPTATFTPTPSATPTFTPSPSATPTDTLTPIPTSTAVPQQQPTTPPPSADPGSSDFPPSSASLQGVPGHNMYYSLDCETRSAVDMAAYFGVAIDHQQFLDSLPYTDDPETGYVGSYRDPAGNIPPYSYGVHSPPIAALLNQYGLSAQSMRGMSLDQLREEIASGRPVMVWVISSVQYGTPQSYTAESTGNTTTVAAYEHTVLVVGYDENYIYIQDGYNSYYRSHNQFLASWGVLGNMAVTVNQ